MPEKRTPRYCRCGTRLGNDRTGNICGVCEKKLATLRARPPDVPAEFWDTAQFRDAFTAQHMGQVCRAYRKHPYHSPVYGSAGIPQEVIGAWLGLTQAQISRVENGAPIRHLDSLARWARTLRIPGHLLWFALRPPREALQAHSAGPMTGPRDVNLGGPENDEMNRRELLRLVSMAGAAFAVPVDWERVEYATGKTAPIDSETLNEYAALNAHLWQIFVLSNSKGTTLPLVRSQISVLTDRLRQSHSPESRRRLCTLAADLFQLGGEISFDNNAYTEAAHCYTLAASAGREADAFDLWACALIRHAFVSLYDQQVKPALPLLELASGLSRCGDRSLSTRHWVAAVQAGAYARLGRLAECQRALDRAEEVHALAGPVHTGGWLRFDGSRLAEERGTCYVALRRPDLAEAILTTALTQHLSARRRGGVHTDLALVGVQRRDRDLLITHADACIDLARQTGSGVIESRLRGLRTQLTPMLDDPAVNAVNGRITAVVDRTAD